MGIVFVYTTCVAYYITTFRKSLLSQRCSDSATYSHVVHGVLIQLYTDMWCKIIHTLWHTTNELSSRTSERSKVGHHEWSDTLLEYQGTKADLNLINIILAHTFICKNRPPIFDAIYKQRKHWTKILIVGCPFAALYRRNLVRVGLPSTAYTTSELSSYLIQASRKRGTKWLDGYWSGNSVYAPIECQNRHFCRESERLPPWTRDQLPLPQTFTISCDPHDGRIINTPGLIKCHPQGGVWVFNGIAQCSSTAVSSANPVMVVNNDEALYNLLDSYN